MIRFQSELYPGRLEQRYKRFLAEITLDDGRHVTAHCPNTGAMTGCAEPGSRVWVSYSDNPKRKYPYTWELVETRSGLACIHSALANRVVGEALSNHAVVELNDYDSVQAEVRSADGGSRLDFELRGPAGRCLVEVKCVTLALDSGRGAFPDAVSRRAARHVASLIEQIEAGRRAVLFFCVFHSGIDRVEPAADIDPDYSRALAEAIPRGLEVIAYCCDISPRGIALGRRIPFQQPVGRDAHQ